MNGVPVVNLNGASAQSLIDARMAAGNAVRDEYKHFEQGERSS